MLGYLHGIAAKVCRSWKGMGERILLKALWELGLCKNNISSFSSSFLGHRLSCNIIQIDSFLVTLHVHRCHSCSVVLPFQERNCSSSPLTSENLALQLAQWCQAQKKMKIYPKASILSEHLKLWVFGLGAAYFCLT